MWVLALILALILLFLSLRISFSAQYSQTGLLLRAGLGPVRITIHPRPKKEGAEPKKRVKKEKPKKAEAPEEKGGSIDKLKAGLSIAEPIVSQIKRRLVISEIIIRYTISTPDAAMTALAYGGAHMAISALLPMIRYHFRVKKQDIQIGASFDGGDDRILLRVKLSISVWGAIRLGLFAFKKVRQSGLLKKSPIQKGAA